MTRSTLGLVLCLTGALLVAIRGWGAHYATRIYRAMGFEVNEQQYAKQFTIVGVLLFLLGIVVAVNLI